MVVPFVISKQGKLPEIIKLAKRGPKGPVKSSRGGCDAEDYDLNKRKEPRRNWEVKR